MRLIPFAALILAASAAQAEETPKAPEAKPEAAQPAAPAAAPAAAADAKPAAAQPSEADCKAAIENLFKIEFAKDPDSASKIDEYMVTARGTEEYQEALQSCAKDFTPELAKCVIGAKNADDVAKCDKEAEAK